MNVLAEIKEEGSIKVTGLGTKKPKPKKPYTPRDKRIPLPTPVVKYLRSIGLELSEDQERQVTFALRIKEERKKGIKYSRTDKEWTEGMKLAPQALLVLDGLGKEPITTGQWIKNLESTLRTNQQPERVVNYYKKSLENLGLIARQV